MVHGSISCNNQSAAHSETAINSKKIFLDTLIIEMKRHVLKQFFCIVLVTCIWACAAAPEKKPLKTDEEYYNRAITQFNARNYFDAIPAFEELKEKFPLSPYAILAELRIGDAHYYKEEYIEAIHSFENFRRLHPNNKSVPYSIYMIGLCYYSQILTLDRDPTYARAAADQFQQLLELYPASPYTGKALFKLSEAKRIMAEHEFFIGQFYVQYKNYPGAINRFNTILKDYPTSIPRDRVIFSIAQANFLSENKQRGVKFLQYLIRKYPESPYAAQAKVLLAAPSPKEEIKKSMQEEEKKQPLKTAKKKFLFF
jgi:outer membrane protein assembly factor BamD